MENVVDRILELLKPEKRQAVLVMGTLALEELEKSGYKVKTVYQMCPESREPGFQKIEYKRVEIGDYEVEFRINTDYGHQFAAIAYVYNIKKDGVIWYKAPEIHLIRV